MSRRNVTIAVIAVLALGVALVVYGILSQPRKSAAPPKNVVIAAMNIPANARVVPAMVTTEQKPSDQVDPSALVDPADAVGMLAVADIPQGAQITPARLARPAAAPQGLQVAVGMRAITIQADLIKGVAGLLQPGDHVDVLASPNRIITEPKTFAIVRDARVLAINQNIGVPQPAPAASGGGSPPPGPPPTPAPFFTVTLAVTPAQADTIMAADLNGTIRLALRSSHEPARSMTAEAFVYPTPIPPKAQNTPPGVQVVNGDQSAEVRP